MSRLNLPALPPDLTMTGTSNYSVGFAEGRESERRDLAKAMREADPREWCAEFCRLSREGDLPESAREGEQFRIEFWIRDILADEIDPGVETE